MLKKLSFIFFISLCLTACSRYATKGEQLYLQSKNEKPVKVLSPLDEKNISHEYHLTSPSRDPVIASLAPPGSEEIQQA